MTDPSFEVTNPLLWLRNNHEQCVMSVYQCITHGDLTGRNILVDSNGRSWLIDFYRTYPSHVLRDFVILETDIKYRLMPQPAFDDFLALETWLLSGMGDERPPVETLPPAMRKPAQVIAKIRGIGYSVARNFRSSALETQKEHLLSLLMATLNVVRLRHINPARKKQALVSASLICGKVDEIGIPRR